jgi:hypothetical protein
VGGYLEGLESSQALYHLRVLKTICLGWFRTVILLISAS